MTRFATQLTLYRERAGISMSELAHRAGISTSTVSRLESGKRAPTPELITFLAEGLGLNNHEWARLSLAAGLLPAWFAEHGTEVIDDLVAAMAVAWERVA